MPPRQFRFDGSVWSVGLYDGVWGLEATSPDGGIMYGSAHGTVLNVQSRDAVPLTLADGAAAKAVAAAYCAKRGGTFDQSYQGRFAEFSKVWEFNGACMK